MDPHDPGHGDHPTSALHFRVVETTAEPSRRWWWKRRHAAPRGIQIVDHNTGAVVAVVFPHAPNATTIATVFANAGTLLYGIGRARVQLRKLAQRAAHPEDEETTAVRQLLREIHGAVDRSIMMIPTQKSE